MDLSEADEGDISYGIFSRYARMEKCEIIHSLMKWGDISENHFQIGLENYSQ